MTWTITPTNLLPDDADAVAYIAAVEAADGEALEPAVRLAYNSFIKGCKADGIWPAIKASCILAGARTLNGALVPLRGTAPTNYNFVAGDYNRKTGLVGDGSTKYLYSGRNNNTDSQSNKHLAVYRSTSSTLTPVCDIGSFVGTGSSSLLYTGSLVFNRVNTSVGSLATTNPLYFWGASRVSSVLTQYRVNGSSGTDSTAVETPSAGAITVFSRGPGGDALGNLPYQPTNARIAFYSIGEALDLALLDTRVTALVNALAAAIP